MIATRSEIKTLLQISDSTKDTLIDALIPIVQDEIVEYCGNHFEKTIVMVNGQNYDAGETVSFDSTAKTINDSENDMPFISGHDVYVSGSRYNDGHYSIVTASTGTLIVSESLIDEAEGANVTIKLVIWPKALKMIVADMIQYKINGKDAGVTSETVSGAMGLSFSQEIGSYPQSLLNGLNKFRVVKFR